MTERSCSVMIQNVVPLGVTYRGKQTKAVFERHRRSAFQSLFVQLTPVARHVANEASQHIVWIKISAMHPG